MFLYQSWDRRHWRRMDGTLTFILVSGTWRKTLNGLRLLRNSKSPSNHHSATEHITNPHTRLYMKQSWFISSIIDGQLIKEMRVERRAQKRSAVARLKLLL